jgi:hypothetical protein
MSRYSQRQIAGAKKARELYTIVGYPSPEDFKSMVRFNLINNCPVNLEDITIAEDIWGKDIGALKGKTTRKKPIQVKESFIPIPKELISKHKSVVLSADVMFVNKMPFLVSISKNIKFTTGERLAGRKLNLLAKGLDHIVEYYARKGFAVRSICIDPELAEVREEMKNKQVEINTAAAKEHVPAIERQIRTIKERVRAQRSRLPFKKLPKALIEGLVLDSIKWLNTFPTKGGLSKQYGARTLLTGVKLDFNIHCRIEIGSYAQVHEEPDITNNLDERTTGGIALGSMDNLQGGYYFLSLKTGKTLRRRNFTKLPMPADVIERVEALANSNDTEIVFEDRLGNEIDEEPDNEIDPEEEVEFPEPYFLNKIPKIQEWR